MGPRWRRARQVRRNLSDPESVLNKEVWVTGEPVPFEFADPLSGAMMRGGVLRTNLISPTGQAIGILSANLLLLDEWADTVEPQMFMEWMA